MERIFTEDVHSKSGEVKFPAGMIRDFPRETWENIERVSGKSLKEFTDIPAEAFLTQFTEQSLMRSRKKLTRKETG